MTRSLPSDLANKALDALLWRVMRPTMRYVWNEGYEAGLRDMDQLRAGRLTFQDITVNPFADEDLDAYQLFWGQSDE